MEVIILLLGVLLFKTYTRLKRYEDSEYCHGVELMRMQERACRKIIKEQLNPNDTNV